MSLVNLTNDETAQNGALLTEHYEKLEPEYQAMVPLKKVYIPVKVE